MSFDFVHVTLLLWKPPLSKFINWTGLWFINHSTDTFIFTHEMWTLLKRNSPSFTKLQKHKTKPKFNWEVNNCHRKWYMRNKTICRIYSSINPIRTGDFFWGVGRYMRDKTIYKHNYSCFNQNKNQSMSVILFSPLYVFVFALVFVFKSIFWKRKSYSIYFPLSQLLNDFPSLMYRSRNALYL